MTVRGCARRLESDTVVTPPASRITATAAAAGGAERDAAQGDAASGVHAALELPERTLDVDADRIVDAVVDIQYVINLPQQSAVGGRRVVPRFDGRGFRSIQLASQVGCQYFFVDL